MATGEPVVITGLGSVTPLGPDCKSFLDGLRQGQSAGRRLDQIESSDGYYPLDLEHGTKIGAPVLETPPASFLTERKKDRFTRSSIFSVLAAHEALTDAGFELVNDKEGHLRPKTLDPGTIGALVGSHFGGVQTFERSHERFQTRGPRQVSPLTVPGMMPNRPAGDIAEIFGLQGPSFAPVAASASSTYSLSLGLDLLRQKRTEVLLAGGTEAVLTPFVLSAFSNLKATTRRNDSPRTASRPFDAERDGFLPAEGAGILILETISHARNRNATPLAELAGAGMSNDAYHLTDPDPEGHGAREAMQRAIQDAGLTPGDIDYLNAHGTSTPKNDPIESQAIKDLFGPSVEDLRISATKSQIGHLLGADGAVESIASVLALRHNIVPPTINYEHPDPDCDLNYTPNEAVETSINTALVNSFGFGGHNGSVCLRTPQAERS
ncbi:MAG: beta-ketoacyl synthase [bacterium]